MNTLDLYHRLGDLLTENEGAATLPVVLIDADNLPRPIEPRLTDAYGYPALVFVSDFAQQK